MNALLRLFRRARYLLRRGELDRAMNEELRFHVEKETEKNIRLGMSSQEARRSAVIAFGGLDRHKEAVREARGTATLDNTLRDVALACRKIRRRGPAT